jgi:transcriptional regulator with XRE-family HTH domain
MIRQLTKTGLRWRRKCHLACVPTHPLRLARQRERFTLRELARVVGLNHARIFQIENGARPSHIEARLLAAALRIPVADLLSGEAHTPTSQDHQTDTGADG